MTAADMTAVFPIWKVHTRVLVARFIHEKFRAITVCIDPRKLNRLFVGGELDAAFFGDLPPAVDPCGENGEFHTFVFDGPILREPIRLEVGRVMERESFIFCDLTPAAESAHR